MTYTRCHRIVFSDLDGTFLEHSTYSYERSLPALRRALAWGDDVVFCSSKTAEEIKALLTEIGLRLPFITENGGSIYLPVPHSRTEAVSDCWSRIPIGTPRRLLLEAVAELRAEVPAVIRGFADMTEREVATLCGFTAAQARLARRRDFDEPIRVEPANPANLQLVSAILARRGLMLSRGGRFFHVTGREDKGGAVQRMLGLLRMDHQRVWSIGVGDAANDVPMLRMVDLPLVVQRPDGSYDPDILCRVGNVLRVGLPGPEGWAAALRILLDPRADAPHRASAIIQNALIP